MKFNPLTSDYWPGHVRRPMIRLALAALSTPALIALIATLLYAAIERFAPYSGPTDSDSLGPFLELALELYIFGALSIGPGFALLWSIRMRSRPSFMLAGLFGGLFAALVYALRFNALSGEHLIIALTLGVVMALTFRTLAGLGEPTPLRRRR